MALLKMTSEKFNQTIILITHNNEIAALADRRITIRDGKIINVKNNLDDKEKNITRNRELMNANDESNIENENNEEGGEK